MKTKNIDGAHAEILAGNPSNGAIIFFFFLRILQSNCAKILQIKKKMGLLQLRPLII